jgi:hypothetical protein
MDSLIELTGGILFTPFLPRLTNELIGSNGELPGGIAIRLPEGTQSTHDETYEITPPEYRSRRVSYIPNRRNVWFLFAFVYGDLTY